MSETRSRGAEWNGRRWKDMGPQETVRDTMGWNGTKRDGTGMGTNRDWMGPRKKETVVRAKLKHLARAQFFFKSPRARFFSSFCLASDEKEE